LPAKGGEAAQVEAAQCVLVVDDVQEIPGPGGDFTGLREGFQIEQGLDGKAEVGPGIELVNASSIISWR